MVEYPNLNGRVVAADGETTGLSWQRDKLFGVAIAFRSETGALESEYFDLRKGNNLIWARHAFASVKLWINHNIKFDAHFFRETGIEFPMGRLACTMIREAIIEENKYEYGLDAVAFKYLQRHKEEIWVELARLFGGKPDKDTQIRNLPRAPESVVAKYAKIDAELAYLIWEEQEKIIESDNLHQVNRLEHDLLPVVIGMERRGVRVDIPAAEEAHRKMGEIIYDLQNKLEEIARRPMNVNSGPQVKDLLGCHQKEDGNWHLKDGTKLEKTEKGAASLDSVKLQQCTLPEAQMIVDLRGYIKARDVFIGKYILQMNHKGYVYANINQTRTEDGNGIYTGRLSITEPALQQIHKRNKKMAAIVRACFVPDEGDDWLCYDWSQMDFRIFAQYLNDYRINEMYAQDDKTDFHSLIASLTGLPRDRDQKTGGANAKQINLACVFGMGAGELAKQCGLPYSLHPSGRYLVAGPEAKALFAKYHDNIKGVRKLQNSVESVAKSRGYILTPVGRHIRFPDGDGAHKAAGLLYQSTAADCMKVKMIEVDKLLKQSGEAELMVVVHDEFDISARRDRRKELSEEIRNVLQKFDGVDTPIKFRIPIRADLGIGENWWAASK